MAEPVSASHLNLSLLPLLEDTLTAQGPTWPPEHPATFFCLQLSFPSCLHNLFKVVLQRILSICKTKYLVETAAKLWKSYHPPAANAPALRSDLMRN
jgi:hypothetical protein